MQNSPNLSMRCLCLLLTRLPSPSRSAFFAPRQFLPPGRVLASARPFTRSPLRRETSIWRSHAHSAPLPPSSALFGAGPPPEESGQANEPREIFLSSAPTTTRRRRRGQIWRPHEMSLWVPLVRHDDNESHSSS